MKANRKMRAEGAELVIFYMHWGDEYALEPNQTQIKMAQFLTDEKGYNICNSSPFNSTY